MALVVLMPLSSHPLPGEKKDQYIVRVSNDVIGGFAAELSRNLLLNCLRAGI